LEPNLNSPTAKNLIPENARQYRLSILLVTYNHERYIEKALKSIFGQVIEGPIELVIADDGSLDRTLAIVKNYEDKDHRFEFKYLSNKSNLGITKNYQRGFAACNGHYVAILEGDDYWSNTMKIQRQVEFLDTHWECDLCAVNYFIYEEKLARFTPRTFISNVYRLIGARELISDNLVGNFSTCMYRKHALDALPQDIYSIKSYDWIVNICVAQHSLIGFLAEPMSVYRLHADAVWSQKSSVEKLKEQLDFIPSYDEMTNYIFQSDFKMLANRLEQNIKILQSKGMILKSIPLLKRVVKNLSDYMPPILLSFFRALVPAKLKRVLISILHGGIE